MTASKNTDDPTAPERPRRGRPPLRIDQRRANRVVIHLDDASAERLTAIGGPDRQPGRVAYDLLITALEDIDGPQHTATPADPCPDRGQADPKRTEQRS